MPVLLYRLAKNRKSAGRSLRQATTVACDITDERLAGAGFLCSNTRPAWRYREFVRANNSQKPRDGCSLFVC